MGLSTTSPHLAVTVEEITDVTAANSSLEVFRQDAMPLESLPLRARRVIVRLASTTVVYHSTNVRVRTRSSAPEGRLACVAFGPRARGSVEGLRLQPGTLLVAEPGVEVGFVADPGYESITLLVLPECLQEHRAARRFEGGHGLPHGVEVLGIDAKMASALFRLGKRLSTAAARRPARFRAGRAEPVAAESELLEALRAATCSTGTVEARAGERTRFVYSRMVEAAESHALAHIEERPRVSDLCRAADAGERTLELAFKEIMGMSPVAYLRRLRLHRVRAALLAANPESTLISAVALQWGFGHFGEFSRAYKQCFGEAPSETLRRRRPVRGSR